MEVSELTLKLIIIIIPGVIATIIIQKLTIHKEWTPFKFGINAIVLGIISYLVLQEIEDSIIFLHNLICVPKQQYKILNIWNTLADSKSIPYKEIFYSSLCAILVGGISTAIEHYAILNIIARKLKLSNKYGQSNLFSNYLNKKETTWIQVRNFKNNMIYFGYAQSFSETDEISEILLAEVSVYTCDESKHLYDLEEVYLSFAKSDIIIEKTKSIQNGNENTLKGGEDSSTS